MTSPGPPGPADPPAGHGDWPANPPGLAGPPPAAAPFLRTPNAERYLLEADSLRRRQLRSALLHGSRRTWRDRRRIWPAAIAGLIVVAVIAAAIAVYGAFQRQQEQQQPQGLPAEPGQPAPALADWSP